MDERKTKRDYSPETNDRVHKALLHIATVLGERMEQITLIGGAVPSLLIPESMLAEGVELHPGTIDLDLGLELSILSDEGYSSIAKLLRDAGYSAMEKDEDRIRRQTWRSDPNLGPIVTIDFLIPRSMLQPKDTRIQNLETDFAALIADGLQLVERDRTKILISGLTIRDERTERSIWVCGPSSFIILKARAIHLREKPKDAYDLYYILSNMEGGVKTIGTVLKAMLGDNDTQEALEFLRQDYCTIDSIGPTRTAYFIHGDKNPNNQDDYDYVVKSAYAYVGQLLTMLK